MTTPPQGPEGNGHSVARLQAQLDQMIAANQARLASLQQQGLAMDPFSFVHARIDMLIDSVAALAGPQGPRWAVLTRMAFEQSVADQFGKAEAEGRKADLAVGARMSPAQISALARASGVFRRQA